MASNKTKCIRVSFDPIPNFQNQSIQAWPKKLKEEYFKNFVEAHPLGGKIERLNVAHDKTVAFIYLQDSAVAERLVSLNHMDDLNGPFRFKIKAHNIDSANAAGTPSSKKTKNEQDPSIKAAVKPESKNPTNSEAPKKQKKNSASANVEQAAAGPQTIKDPSQTSGLVEVHFPVVQDFQNQRLHEWPNELKEPYLKHFFERPPCGGKITSLKLHSNPKKHVVYIVFEDKSVAERLVSLKQVQDPTGPYRFDIKSKNEHSEQKVAKPLPKPANNVVDHQQKQQPKAASKKSKAKRPIIIDGSNVAIG